MRSDLSSDGPPPRQTPGQRTRWDTQDAAWQSVQPRLHTNNHKVLAAIRDTPRTCDELEQALGLTHQTCSAAVNSLMNAGLIVASGYRKTRSGRSARVWREAQSEFLFPVGMEGPNVRRS
jgi:hypothetical protein